MKKIASFLLVLTLATSFVSAQDLQPVPFTSENWDFGDAQFTTENYMGVESLQITNGLISLSDVELLDGTIEVDVNFPNARFFPSVLFRMQDPQNSENFYIRPHQSGNPDAAQYTPVFNGVSGWQLYHGEGYSQATELEPDLWHHIKINILGDEADIYFNDMETPLLKVTDLKREPRAGKIALSTGAPVHFANFKYSLAKPTLVNRETTQMETPPGLITEWNISNVVQDDVYRDKPEINAQNLFWRSFQTEPSGTINLARFGQRSEGMNTVIAKLDLTAADAMRKPLVFGYSDFIWIYINGKQIYGGRNDFRSRDFRYLGTIGFFDSVFLPLNEGNNEVLFVVGENFGGWGLKAFMPDQQGIEIKKNKN